MKSQTFNDGIATVYKTEKNSEPGNLAKVKLVVREVGLRYDELKVGVTRYYAGKQNKIQIDQLLRMPRVNSVSVKDIVKASDGNQYEIKQIQYPPEIYPPSMDLSLERDDTVYVIEGS